jgi:hypothetical protein
VPIKPSPCHPDFRYSNLLAEMLPLLALAAVLVIGAIWWRTWGIPAMAAGIYGFLRIARHSTAWRYRIAARSLGTPPGRPGLDYLLFEAETPETAHKTRLVGEDEGFIFAEDGALRIRSVWMNERIPVHAFRYEPMQKSKLVAGVLLAFVPEGSSEERRLAVTFTNLHPEGESETDIRANRDQTIRQLEAIIQQASSPHPADLAPA